MRCINETWSHQIQTISLLNIQIAKKGFTDTSITYVNRPITYKPYVPKQNCLLNGDILPMELRNKGQREHDLLAGRKSGRENKEDILKSGNIKNVDVNHCMSSPQNTIALLSS